MKRITALLLTLVLAAFTVMPAWSSTAKTTESMKNFTRRLTYTPGMFDDVDENAWYGANRQACIKTVYELGIMDGMDDGTFLPAGNIRLCEIIKMAAVVHSIYSGNKTDFSGAVPWYESYVDYAVKNGIIREGQYDYQAYATRTDLAYIISGCLPESEFSAINTVNSIPDVNTSTLWYDRIFLLYRAGVLSGDEGSRTYRPSDRCSRAEAAAIITRAILPQARLRFDLLTYNSDPGNHAPDFAIQNAAGDTLALGHQATGAIRAFFDASPVTTQIWAHDKDINLVSSAYAGAPDVRYLNCAHADSGVYVFFLRIDGSQYSMPSGIGCGSTEEELQAAYGDEIRYEPVADAGMNVDGAYIRYVYENDQVLTASFYINEGKVVSITLSCLLH